MAGAVATDEKRRAVLQSLGTGASRLRACEAARLDRRTFYRWLHNDDTFRTEAEAAELGSVMAVEDALYRDALEGKTTAQIFFLLNRAPDRWQDRRNLHVQQNVTVETQLDRDIADLAEQLGVADSPLVKAALNGHDS